MILVIADDLTGAAELAGIGWRYGLRVEVQTRFYATPGTDLIVLDTNSRSVSAVAASGKLERALRRIKKRNIDWIYKKTDSVLRGPVLPELKTMISFLKMKRALLMPANPSMQRIIRDGHYFIKGKPLCTTDFAMDPEYPATSSDVIQLLKKNRSAKIFLLRKKQSLPDKGIIVSDAVCKEDVQYLARIIDAETLPAGAADFFSALLEQKGFSLQPEHATGIFQTDHPLLFIAGSSFGLSSNTLKAALKSGIPVFSFPAVLLKKKIEVSVLLQEWTDKILAALHRNFCAMIAINQPLIKDPVIVRKFTYYLSLVTKEVLNKILIKNLFIEGGSTASELMRSFKWTRFTVLKELASGIVQLQVIDRPAINISLKPGSYPWPAFIWQKIRN